MSLNEAAGGPSAAAADADATADAEASAAAERERLQRRTVRTLAISQIVAGVGVATGFGVATLLAAELANSTTLVGFELTASTLGSAAAATVLAALSHRVGRRRGLVAGYLMGALGAVICIGGAAAENFWLYLVGMVCYGWAAAAGFQARFAAGDLASEETRGRAVSFVLWSGTIGTIVGPNLTEPGTAVAGALGLPDLSGVFLFSLVGFLASAALIARWLRPDPLLTARGETDGGAGPAAGQAPPRRGLEWRRALSSTAASPGARLSVVALATSHLVMVSLMAMTMLHIGHDADSGGDGDHAGHAAAGDETSLGLVGLVFSLHLAGMSGFSPLFGWAADRLGRPLTLMCGLGISGVSFALLGTSPDAVTVQAGAGMLLLGLGWSCVIVTGSTLLSESVSAEQRPVVQGLSDTLMLVCGAGGTAMSGIIVTTFGYPALNVMAACVLLPAVLLCAWHQWSRPAVADAVAVAEARDG